MCALLKNPRLLVPFTLKRHGYAAALPQGLHGTRKETLCCAYNAQHEVCHVVQCALEYGPEEVPGKCSPIYVCGYERNACYFRIELVAVLTRDTKSSSVFKRGKRYESAKEDEGEANEDEIQHRYWRRPDTRPSGLTS